MAETSNELSKLAARYMRYSPGQLAVEVRSRPEALASDIRSLAASALRQDETKGLRHYLRKAFGMKSAPFPPTFMSSEDRP